MGKTKETYKVHRTKRKDWFKWPKTPYIAY
jgi:hypothetical protein